MTAAPLPPRRARAPHGQPLTRRELRQSSATGRLLGGAEDRLEGRAAEGAQDRADEAILETWSIAGAARSGPVRSGPVRSGPVGGRRAARQSATGAMPAIGATGARSTGARSTGSAKRRFHPGLTLIGVALLAWAATSLVDLGRGWGALGAVPVFAAASAQLICVVAVPVLALAYRARSWLTIGLTLVAAVLPWVFVLGYAVPAPQRSGPSTVLRAMLVDATRTRTDPQDVVDAVRGHGVDLLVVTSLTSTFAHDLTQAGLDVNLRARWVNADGSMGVWSRFAVDRPQAIVALSGGGLRATLTSGAMKLTLVTGQLTPPGMDADRWRADLSALTGSAPSSGSVLVLADLHSAPTNPQFRAALRLQPRLHDAADLLGRGLRPTWPSWSPLPLIALDHAFVAGRISVQSVATERVTGSPHRALFVTLSVQN